MRLWLSVAGSLIVCTLLTSSAASATHGGGGGMNGGVYNSSMVAVQRERQEKTKICARLYPSFDSGSMSYVGRNGRPHRCP
jgi:hypothetical protein